MAKTRAQINRAVRQEQLRDYLSNLKLTHQVIDIAKNIQDLAYKQAEDFNSEDEYVTHVKTAKDKCAMLKMSADLNLSLIKKYMPDLQHQDINVEATHTVLGSLIGEVMGDTRGLPSERNAKH